MATKTVRTTNHLRFREGGGSILVFPWFVETDPKRLIGRAMVWAWWSAEESGNYVVDPATALFVEVHGPDEKTWTIAGRFLFADLLGGYEPQRWDRLLEDAQAILKTAHKFARSLAYLRRKSS
jgi:hypothetical protein